MPSLPPTVDSDEPCSPIQPRWPQQPGASLRWRHLLGSGRGLAIARTAEGHAGPLLVITRDTRTARQIEDEIRFYLGEAERVPLLPFPDWESLPYDAFAPHPDIISERLLTLYRLPELAHGIVLLTAATLQHRLPPKTYVSGHTFVLNAGSTLDIEAFRARLQQAGYQSVAQVMEPGEYAVRGGIVDVFPMGAPAHYRIDLFGEKVESVQLAKKYDLMLHAHSDARAVERLFAQWPQARILWAHDGSERPEKVREMLRKHRNLWADLAFRSDHGADGKPPPEWRAAFVEFPDRFMVGTDTYVPERWHYVPEHAVWSRAWLADLPPDVAERIAWKNGVAVLGAAWAKAKKAQ